MNDFRAYVKVLGWIFLNNVIGQHGQKLIGTKHAESARYCYSVWLRHLVLTNKVCNTKNIPAVVAEIGPGDSLGTGFAALLSGAEKYYSLDVVHYCDVEKNLSIFDEMVQLFQDKEDIPDDEEFPKINPKLDSYSFPDYLINESRLRASLSNERLKYIRKSIISTNSNNGCIYYHVPWTDSSSIQENSVDFIFSQAVLEHVDDLPLVYNSMKKWLKDSGVISHTIDFKSHGTSVKWNGHWGYSNLAWKIVRGRAIYLINRMPLSFHLKCLDDAGFELIYSQQVKGDEGIQREKLAEDFRELSDLDLNTSVAYLVCKIVSKG